MKLNKIKKRTITVNADDVKFKEINCDTRGGYLIIEGWHNGTTIQVRVKATRYWQLALLKEAMNKLVQNEINTCEAIEEAVGTTSTGDD